MSATAGPKTSQSTVKKIAGGKPETSKTNKAR